MNFVQFIQITVEAEAKLEEIRMLLASFENFELFTVYKRLDQPRTGGLKQENLLEFLVDNNIKVQHEELEYIFRYFDTDMDGVVTFQDFKNIILPKQNEQMKDQVLNHKNYDMPKGMLLPQEVENQLSQFFIQLQQNFNYYMTIAEPINLNQLDIYDKARKITVESLQNWLFNQNVSISEDIIQNFVIIIDESQLNLQNMLDQIYVQYDQQIVQYNEEEEEYIEGQPQEKPQEDMDENPETVIQRDNNEREEFQDSLNPQIASQKEQEQDFPQEEEEEYDGYKNYAYVPKYIPNSYIKREIINEELKLEKSIRELEQRILYQKLETQLKYSNKSQIDKEYYSLNSKAERLQKQLPYFPDNDYLRNLIQIEQEIMREEIRCKVLETQLQNSRLNFYIPTTQVQPLHQSKYQQALSKKFKVFESPKPKQKDRNYFSGEKNESFQKNTATFGQRKINQSGNKKWV